METLKERVQNDVILGYKIISFDSIKEDLPFVGVPDMEFCDLLKKLKIKETKIIRWANIFMYFKEVEGLKIVVIRKNVCLGPKFSIDDPGMEAIQRSENYYKYFTLITYLRKNGEMPKLLPETEEVFTDIDAYLKENRKLAMDIFLRNSVDSPSIIHMKMMSFHIAIERQDEFRTSVIRDCLRREIENKNYTVFYHGQRIRFFLLQELFNLLYQRKQQLKDYVFIRYPKEQREAMKGAQCKRSDEYYTGAPTNTSEKYDWDNGDCLLSTNLTLFGNSMNEGESTWAYFVGNSSNKNMVLMDEVELMFKVFGFPNIFRGESDLYQIVKSMKDYETEMATGGILLQIFIPNDLVPKMTYLCDEYGIKFVKYNKDYGQDVRSALRHFVEEAKKQNEEYDENQEIFGLDSIQARIATNDQFTDPNNGIKIFRYYRDHPTLQDITRRLSVFIDSLLPPTTSLKK